MTLHESLRDIKLTLPIVGTVGAVGIGAALLIIFLLRRKKTISFKV